MKNVAQLADKIAQLMREAGVVNYGQTRHVFKQVRQSLALNRQIPEGRDPLKCISHEDLHSFLIEAHCYSETRGLMLQTLYETAVRVSEFVNLQVEDFSHEQRILMANRMHGAKGREVPVTVTLANRLLKEIGNREEGPLFRSRRGKAYTPQRIQQIVEEVTDTVGIRIPVTPYTLRYTRATDLAEAGMLREELHQITGGINWINVSDYLPVDTKLTVEAYDRASQEVSRRLSQYG